MRASRTTFLLMYARSKLRMASGGCGQPCKEKSRHSASPVSRVVARRSGRGRFSWMQRFHCRHGIAHRRGAGEAGLREQAPAGRDTQRGQRGGDEEGSGSFHAVGCLVHVPSPIVSSPGRHRCGGNRATRKPPIPRPSTISKSASSGRDRRRLPRIRWSGPPRFR